MAGGDEHHVDAFDEQPGVASDQQNLRDQKDDRHGLALSERVVEGLCEKLAEDRRPDAVRGDSHDVEDGEAGKAKTMPRSFSEKKAERKERQHEVGRPGLLREDQQRQVE